MKSFILKCAIGALVAAGLCQNAQADETSARQELAPTGKLRVAIAVSPAPSAVYAIKDPATGEYRGVTVALGTLLAEKLGVPVEFVAYNATGEIVNAADKDAWDVSFMPVEDERRKFVDFGSAYHLLQSTYLVAPGSAIKDVKDANRSGVRIAGIPGTMTFRASNATATNATHVAVPSVDEAVP